VSAVESLGRELLRAASEFDVLIIDTSAGISHAVTHFLNLAQDSIILATPSLASTLDAYGVIKLAHETRLSTRLHLLINQAENEQQAGRVIERIAGCAQRYLDTTPRTIGFLGHDPAFERSAQSRTPFLLGNPSNPNARRIAAIAARFIDDESEKEKQKPERAAACEPEVTSAAA
jgi:flagellar biosynthesis protein FlhG